VLGPFSYRVSALLARITPTAAVRIVAESSGSNAICRRIIGTGGSEVGSRAQALKLGGLLVICLICHAIAERRARRASVLFREEGFELWDHVVSDEIVYFAQPIK
jgi:hypothetical protein